MHDLVIALAFIGLMVAPAVIMAKAEELQTSRKQVEHASAKTLKTC
jgi:hypothetical protein